MVRNIASVSEDYVGKVKIRSDGTALGTKIFVLDDDLREVKISAVELHVSVRAGDDFVSATIHVAGVALDVVATAEVKVVAP